MSLVTGTRNWSCDSALSPQDQWRCLSGELSIVSGVERVFSASIWWLVLMWKRIIEGMTKSGYFKNVQMDIYSIVFQSFPWSLKLLVIFPPYISYVSSSHPFCRVICASLLLLWVSPAVLVRIIISWPSGARRAFQPQLLASGWWLLAGGGCAGHYREVNSGPGLYALDARSAPPLWQPDRSPDIALPIWLSHLS